MRNYKSLNRGDIYIYLYMCTCRHIYRHPFPGIQDREVLTFPGMDSEEARNDGRRHNETNPGAAFRPFFHRFIHRRGRFNGGVELWDPHFVIRIVQFRQDFQTGPSTQSTSS